MIERRLKLEQLERRLLLASDFGDAPEPYATLEVDNGAEHEAVGPQLGQARDTESDGIPSHMAEGDGSDEDGVTFSKIRVGQLDATATVQVENAPDGARLDAWIDFNGDGSWDGAGEQIAVSLSVVEGSNTIEFTVPANIPAGATYARFRLSTAGGLLPKGVAPDGEVEDFLIEILPPRPTLGIDPAAISIETSMQGVSTVQASDLDNDGDQDLIAGVGNSLVWLENDSTGSFTEHTIANNNEMSVLSSADIDRDGDRDILVAWQSNGSIAWYENEGANVFTEHIITSSAWTVSSLDIADLDADGDLDILSASSNDDTIAWYENDGDQQFTSQIVDRSSFDTDGANYVKAIDMDRDGDLDILTDSNGFFGDLAWYENHGKAQTFSRHEHNISDDRNVVFPVDLDNDGDMDIISSHETFGSTYSIQWLRNDGTQGFSNQAIASGVHGLTSLKPADVDGDGDVDLVTSSTSSNAVIVFLNNGFQRFEEKPVFMAPDGSTSYAMNEVVVADMDNDGDLDVIAATRSLSEILWFESVPNGIMATPTPAQIVEDSAESAVFVFSRASNIDISETLTFEVLGTAAFGIDYTVSGADTFSSSEASVTLPAGEKTIELTITAVPDTEFEKDETVVLRLVDYADFDLPEKATNPFDATATILRDEPQDFGDAPDSYLTTLAVGGASHGTTGPTLGASRDADADGQPSDGAVGDGVDDDGVTFTSARVGQQDAPIVVNVQNAPEGARLDAWFDFNGDGNWFGPWEQVATNVPVVEGDNVIGIDIPADAKSGEVYARFRLSTEGGLTSMGHAVDGEVEDYLLTIDPPLSGGGFRAVDPIDDQMDGARNVSAIDMDGDGDLDVVAVGTAGRKVAWYENDGNQDFTKHVIETTPSSVVALLTIDFNRDGHLDIVVGTNARDADLLWYENDGTQNFTSRTLDTSLDSSRVLSAGDLDSDGDLDLAIYGVIRGRDTTIWLENRSEHGFQDHILIEGDSSSYSLAVADFDGNGTLDIVAQGFIAGQSFPWESFLLLRNNGSGEFSTEEIFLSPTLLRTNPVDIDNDGDQDIVLTGGIGMLIAINNGTGAFDLSYWGGDGRSTNLPADVDGDGDFDVLTSSVFSDTLAWRENPGAMDPFPLHFISTKFEYAHWIAPGDIDGDGDLDVVGAAEGGDLVSWFENIPQNSGDFDDNDRVDGFDFLNWQRNHGATSATRAEGDADQDGDVDGDDLGAWSGTYGYHASEPSPDSANFQQVADASLVEHRRSVKSDPNTALSQERLPIHPATRNYAPQPRDTVFAELGEAAPSTFTLASPEGETEQAELEQIAEALLEQLFEASELL